MSRTALTRLADLQSDDRSALDSLLDSCNLGHFALAADGHPLIIPTLIARNADVVLAHGSTGSTWMRRLSTGMPTALAVTAVDGLVVARSAFESSMRYRSAVLFGRCTALSDNARKRAALDAITEHLLSGRSTEVREPTGKELAATVVLELPIEEWSLKISDGWPDDPESDVSGDAWAGVVLMRTRYGAPIPAPDLRAGIDIPESVRALTTVDADWPGDVDSNGRRR